jgi:hypothetical protein
MPVVASEILAVDSVPLHPKEREREEFCIAENYCDLKTLLRKYIYYKTWMSKAPVAENMILRFCLFICSS